MTTVRLPLFLGLLSAGLLAQDPAKTPRPAENLPDIKTTAVAPVRTGSREPRPRSRDVRPGTEIKAAAAVERSIPGPDQVLTDASGDAVWAMGRDYKVRFSADAVEFHPFLGPDAPRNFPLRLGMPHVTSGGELLAPVAAKPRLHDDRVVLERGAFTECFDLALTNVEQSFEFGTLPSRDELVVRIPFASELEPAPFRGGLRFAGEHGAVTYGQAVAISADGRRLPLSTRAESGAIRIVVPADFVKKAVLPLIVDPLIGTESTVHSGPRAVRSSDIAFDESTGEYLAVWQTSYSSSDQDIFAQRMSASMQNVGNALAVDFTSACWTRPKVANNGLWDRFLVVAEVSDSCSSPFWIGGRTVDAGTGTLGTPFDIAKAGEPGHDPGDKIRPDVGGDPNPFGPTYFTVVWERALSVSDHDIHMKQVQATGALVSATPTRIDNSFGNERHPTISNSNGTGPHATQRWGVAYQRTSQIGSGEDIRGALVTWDGVLVPVNGADNFQIDGSNWHDRHPTISTPTDPGSGPRTMMVAYESLPIGGSESDIYARVMDTDGNMLTGVDNLTLREAGGLWTTPFRGWPQTNPSVDSDGCRFAIAFEELHNGTGIDWDTVVCLYGLDPGGAGSFLLQSGRERAGNSTSLERGVAITSTRGSGGDPVRYALSWYDERGTADDAIEAQLFDGFVPGSITTRPTGCGGLTLTSAGIPAVGATVTVHSSATGLGGFLYGFPASVLATFCPGCELGVTGSTLIGTTLDLQMPCAPVYVGLTLSVQAFDFAATGPCLGQIKLSDTIDLDLH